MKPKTMEGKKGSMKPTSKEKWEKRFDKLWERHESSAIRNLLNKETDKAYKKGYSEGTALLKEAVSQERERWIKEFEELDAVIDKLENKDKK